MTMEEGTVTTMIDPSRTLGELVLVSPSLAAEFDQLGLDDCCGGNHSLAQVCERAGLDVSDVVARLSIVPPRAPAPWASLGPAELVDHIEATHHAYLWQELPRLTELADKVARVHGHRHPELADVVAVVGQLRADLEPHLLEEERVLFPRIRQLVAVVGTPTFECGDLRNPISVMLTEHERVGTLLTRTREVTGDFTVPPDGCASYAALYHGLSRVETDTHLHVHKENNLLFPAVVDLEAGRSRQH